MIQQPDTIFRSLPPLSQTILLAAVAERLFPMYHADCETDGFEDPKQYRSQLDQLWETLLGKIPQQTPRSLLQKIQGNDKAYARPTTTLAQIADTGKSALCLAIKSYLKPLSKFDAAFPSLRYPRFLPIELVEAIASVQNWNPEAIETIRRQIQPAIQKAIDWDTLLKEWSADSDSWYKDNERLLKEWASELAQEEDYPF